MRYLLQVDGKIYGYDNVVILRIHLAEQKPELFNVFKRADSKLKLSYEPISFEELKELDND